MATIDSLCVLVELERVPDVGSFDMTRTTEVIKRVIRSYESRSRAEEDLELLNQATPHTSYRIDDIVHIER